MRDNQERCFPSIYRVVPLSDGAIVIIRRSAPTKGSMMVRLDSAMNELFRVGPLGDALSGVEPFALPDGKILVRTNPEAILFDSLTGKELKRYRLRFHYDDKTRATGEVLSGDASKWFSCVRDTLVVRDTRSGAVEGRFPRTCALEEGNPVGGPSPSVDGRFTSLVCRGRQPCVVRARDGARLVLHTGLTAEEVGAFFTAQ